MNVYHIKIEDEILVLKSLSGGNRITNINRRVKLKEQRNSLKSSRISNRIAINEVLIVEKSGILDYKMMLGNSDTNGIDINMVNCATVIKRCQAYLNL